MDIICTITCPDCGEAIVTDPDEVDIFIIDTTLAIAKCPDCGTSIVKWLSKDKAKYIANKGAKIFSFRTCNQVSIEALT